MTPNNPLDSPWPSTATPAVQLIQLNRATIDALADEDLDLANEQATVELSPYFVEPASARTWRYRSRQLAITPEDADWITRVIYDPVRRLAVGQSGYHGAPDTRGMVEVGYAVDVTFRRRGTVTCGWSGTILTAHPWWSAALLWLRTPDSVCALARDRSMSGSA